jgi:hypothetical protein
MMANLQDLPPAGSTVLRGSPALRARVALIVASVAGAALCLAPAAQATSTPITIGTASNYGVLTGIGETLNLAGGFKLTGNLGVAKGFNVINNGTNSVSGTAYYDYTAPQGTYSGSGTLSDAATVNQSMSQPVADAAAATVNAAALTATAGLTDQGASITSSATINALTNLSQNVLDVSAVSLTNATLTFNDNGFTGAKYIINVTGAFSLSNTTIKVTGGASASDILFNIEGTNQTVSITGGTTLGTLLVPNSNITIGGGGTLAGDLIAGVNNAGKGYTLTEQSSGYNITSFPYIPQTSKVPEPSSIALLGGGLAVVAVARRRRSRRG